MGNPEKENVLEKAAEAPTTATDSDLNTHTEKTKDFVEGSTFEKLNLNKWLIEQCKIVG